MKTAALFFVLALPFLSSVTQVCGFDFFYLVLQWPGSFCDAEQKCCYPNSGKPAAEFLIHGLWPNNNDGSYPSNCDPDNSFASSQISDLMSNMEANWPSLACPSSNGYSFWAHEWSKHGTCADSIFNEHDYFEAALNLKDKVDILQILSSSGIEPNDNSYSLSSIEEAIQTGFGFTSVIDCNKDVSGSIQLYQVQLCVDKTGTSFIACPDSSSGSGRCSSEVKFPSF
ncbi:Ribonuclease 1 [Platanthera guangdongensis]|uniref:Ribonuclease 1 n=1 Tax=Platanthera guangdongensis TaxID=2320717 RepID=A0ABR2LR93_9ASPA